MKILITESQFKLIKENQEFLNKIFVISKSDYDLAKVLAIGQGTTIDEIIATEVEKMCEDLMPGLFLNTIVTENRIIITLKGEKTYYYHDNLSKIRSNLPKQYRSNLGIEIKFEKPFTANVTYEKDGKEYDVTLTKRLDSGDEFELSGRLDTYNTGRADEFELDPYDISDEEYYSKNWEIIEEFIINNIPNKKKK